MTDVYMTNQLGDVVQLMNGGETAVAVDPSTWGWLKDGGANDPGELRRSVGSLTWMPGFSVTEQPTDTFIPGPSSTGRWRQWSPGTAPPAAVESVGGTRAYFNRLSEAAGYAALSLTKRRVADGATSMTIWDFVGGREFTVTYAPPGSVTAGTGRVYLVDDGTAVKVGITYGAVASRMRELQTGNPRLIGIMAEIPGATEATELALHETLAEANVSGEWFDRRVVVEQVTAHGSVEAWLRSLGVIGDLEVHVHPPYR